MAVFGQHGGAQQGGAQRGGQLAGALEVQTGEGVLELRQLEHLQQHIGADQQRVHLIGVEGRPEVHQLVIGEHAGALGL